MRNLWPSLLFLPLLDCVASVEVCHGQNSCESRGSWIAAAEEEDGQSLEMLQKRGSKVNEGDESEYPDPNLENVEIPYPHDEEQEQDEDAPHLKLAPLAEDNGCAMPNEEEFIQGGRRCPHHGACLEDNKHFTSLVAAWEECATSEFCGAVMEVDGSFFLRRESDPWESNDNLKLYRYTCKKKSFQKNAIRAEAKVKAKKMMKKAAPLEKFKMEAEMHDVRVNTKKKMEEEKKKVIKKGATLAKEKDEAKQQLKAVEESTKKSREVEAEEQRQLASAEAEMKAAEQQAAEEERALQQLITDREKLKHEQTQEVRTAQEVAQAKKRVVVAEEVEADAEKAEEQVEEKAKKYTVTVPELIKEMERKLKADTAAKKLLEVQAKEEEQKLEDLKRKVKRQQRKVDQLESEERPVHNKLHDYVEQYKEANKGRHPAALVEEGLEEMAEFDEEDEDLDYAAEYREDADVEEEEETAERKEAQHEAEREAVENEEAESQAEDAA